MEMSGAEVRADVYGGAEFVCGTVLYEMPDVASARRRAATLRRWAKRGTPLTYVRRGSTASLVDEQGFLAASLEGAD